MTCPRSPSTWSGPLRRPWRRRARSPAKRSRAGRRLRPRKKRPRRPRRKSRPRRSASPSRPRPNQEDLTKHQLSRRATLDRREAASSVAPVFQTNTNATCVLGLAPPIAPLRRARFRQTLLAHLKIGEDEALSLDEVADSTGNRLGKAGARVDERVEFAPLAARVDVGGQLGEQALVVLATGERAVELLRVYAYEHRAKAGGDELVRQSS